MALSGIPQAQYPNFARSSPVTLGKVPLDNSDPFALPDRDYDHATVAINSDRDVVVAFHSSRTDTSAKMKQVEIAYYQWQTGDTWIYKGSKLVGNIGFDPIPLGVGPVKCEFPDVIAVDDKFFAVWVRRYQGPQVNPNEPAVLECAWIDLDTNGNIRVHQNGNPLGQGFPLDFDGSSGTNYWIRECGGVPEAVRLNDASSPYKVAVVYPHQTTFSGGGALNRTFEIRIVTCELDATTLSVSIGTAQPKDVLVPIVQFNGISSPSGSSGGLVLPDLAVSSEDNAFWLAAERQIEVGGDPEGKIYLGYWKFESGQWTEKASRTYQSSNSADAFARRRPMISAYPEAGQNELVALAFNKIDLRQPPFQTQVSKNVIYKQVEYDPSGSLNTPSAVYPQWPNTTSHDDLKPSPIQGRSAAPMARAYAGRSLTTGGTQDLINNLGTVIDTSTHITGARPALSYYYEASAASPDYVAITWEKKVVAGGQLQVWVGVE